MKRHLPLLAALCFAIVLSIFRIGPPSWGPETHLPGSWVHPDNLSNQWLLVWVAEQLSDGSGIIHNDRYYWPIGDYPWLAGNGSEGFLFLPFWLLLGWPTSVGVYVTFVWVAIGMASYRLGRVCGAGEWGSLFTLTAVLSLPFLGRELTAGRFSQMNLIFLLLSLSAFIELMRKPSRNRAILCGLLVALCGVFYWYYAFFFALMAVIICACRTLTKASVPWRETLMAACVALLLCVPVLFYIVSNWERIPGHSHAFPSNIVHRDSLPFTNPLHWQPGLLSLSAVGLMTVGWIGVTVLYYRHLVKERWLIFSAITTAVLFYLLGLGVNTPVFEALYGLNDKLKRFWWPSRHMMVFNIALIILASMGVGAWLKSRNYRIAWALGIALSVPLIVFLQAPWSMQANYSELKLPHRGYETLSEMDGDVIWQPPLHSKIACSQSILTFQHIHGKRLLGGHAMWLDWVRPKEWSSFVEDSIILESLRRFEVGYGKRLVIDGEDVLFLPENNIDYAVLDVSLFPIQVPKLVDGYREALTTLYGDPVYDDDITIWDTRRWTGETKVVLPTIHVPDSFKKGEEMNCNRRGLFPSQLHAQQPFRN